MQLITFYILCYVKNILPYFSLYHLVKLNNIYNTITSSNLVNVQVEIGYQRAQKFGLLTDRFDFPDDARKAVHYLQKGNGMRYQKANILEKKLSVGKYF